MKRSWSKIISVALLMSFVALVLGGCNSPGQKATSGNQDLPRLGEERKEDSLTGSGLDREAVKAVPQSNQTVIVLYFSDKDGYLAAEQRIIEKTPGVARAAMNELIKGPAGSGLSPTIPAGTLLRDINIKDGLVTVDFSRQLKAGHGGGSTGELVTVYSIVNTLTQFPSAQKVRILIEGRAVDTLAGHLDLSQPLERNGNIIKSGSWNNMQL